VLVFLSSFKLFSGDYFMNWKKNVLAKKIWRYSVDFGRPILANMLSGPVVLANSFPKSGTHLLTQILEPLGQIDFGNFISSTPSFSMKELSGNAHIKAINSLLPNEMSPAHMYYSEEYEVELKLRNIIHFFIFRDPRDVVVSDANYLANMNRWHKLHPYLKAAHDRYDLVIRGVETDKFYWPNIGERMARYNAWLNCEDVCAVRYEDLMGSKRGEELERMVEFYKTRVGASFNSANMVQRCIDSIDPARSHTFHKGSGNSWNSSLTRSNIELFESVAGQICSDWGYKTGL